METTQGSTETTAENTSPVETNTNTQEQTTAQGSAEQTQAQTTPNLKKFKLKVDGEEFEEELDLSNEAEIVKRLQLAKAAEKRIGQAKSEKQKAMEILKAFEEGTLLKKHPKAKEMAEALLLEQIQNEMLTPEQKRLKELEQFYNQKQQEEAMSKEQQAKAAQAAMEQKVAAEFQQTIISALDKSGLPKTPEMAKRMAYIMKKNLDLGLPLTADDLVQEVKSEVMGLVKSLVGSSVDGDQLISLLGDDVAKKIRASDVKRLKEKMAGGNTPAPRKESSTSMPKSKDKPMSIDEWKEQIAERMKSL